MAPQKIKIKKMAPNIAAVGSCYWLWFFFPLSAACPWLYFGRLRARVVSTLEGCWQETTFCTVWLTLGPLLTLGSHSQEGISICSSLHSQAMLLGPWQWPLEATRQQRMRLDQALWLTGPAISNLRGSLQKKWGTLTSMEISREENPKGNLDSAC